MVLENIRVVLVRPRRAANVGAAARAMKNTGLGDLVIVGCRPPGPVTARRLAVHAADVLERARLAPTLTAAVADCHLVIGTTCRDGRYRREARSPRAASTEIVRAARAGSRAALVFGPEDHGLSNRDLLHCDQLLRIPTAGYPSLNIAQAVLICGYELLLAAGAPAGGRRVARASAARVGFMLDRLRAALLGIGFLQGQNPDHIMFAIRALLGRAGLEDREVSILLGVARQIEWAASNLPPALRRPTPSRALAAG